MRNIVSLCLYAVLLSACTGIAVSPTLAPTQPPPPPPTSAPKPTTPPASPTTPALTQAASVLPTNPPAPITLKIYSPEFEEGKPIPKKFTCDGSNNSPTLAWTGIPVSAKSLALIMDDPDAPGRTFVHWVVYNLAPSLNGLPEAMPAGASLNGGGSQGPGSSGRSGYTGPCPPSGAHRYFYKLYVLDLEPSLPAGLDKAALEKQLESHIVTQAQFMGTYQR